MKTDIRWYSDQQYSAECICVSLDPPILFVNFTDSKGHIRKRKWVKDEARGIVGSNSWVTQEDNDYPNYQFAEALESALEYFIALDLDNKMDNIILDSTESKPL